MKQISPPRIIETKRLILRPPKLSDAKLIFASVSSDPEVARYMSFKTAKKVIETSNFIRHSIQARILGKEFNYVICLKASRQKIIGTCGIGPTNTQCSSHWGGGYCLSKEHWGNGFATEAFGALAEWALLQPHIFRVSATVIPKNAASCKVLKKLGFKREGILRRYCTAPNISNDPVDAYVYSRVK